MQTETIEKIVMERLKREDWSLHVKEDIISLAEEVGELCREVRRMEIGRERPDETQPPEEEIREAITEEIGDILFSLVKIAHTYESTLEQAFLAHQTKMNERYQSTDTSYSEQEWQFWLELAEIIATSAHKGQVDKGGHDYIEHPRRVASRMKTPPEKIVAWLHDVVEDTPWTLDRLAQETFPPSIIEAVDAITKRENETREAYLYRLSQNELARRIKKDGDLLENMDLSRLPTITEKDKERLRWYTFARAVLEGAGTSYVYGKTFDGASKWIQIEPSNTP